MSAAPRQRLWAPLGWAAAACALAAVFLLYTRPSLLATLAEQVWACVH